eukprot:jgi/Botrbrau1/7048/Bobra.0165s0071.1
MLLLQDVKCFQGSVNQEIRALGVRSSNTAISDRSTHRIFSHHGLVCSSFQGQLHTTISSSRLSRTYPKGDRWGSSSTFFRTPVKVFGRPNVCLRSRDRTTTMYLLSSGTLPLAAAAIVGGATAIAYWDAVRMSRKPAIIRQKTAFNEAVLSRCPTVHELYEVPLFLSNGHIETIAASKLRKDLKRVYVRELLTMSDGGTVALDYEDLKSARELPDDAPVMVVLPGLTGGSHDTYVQHMVGTAHRQGIRAVVFNSRGTSDAPVTTPQFYSASFTGDMKEVIRFVERKFPRSPIFAAGYSLGANILVNYLGEVGINTPILAAVSMCKPL